MTTGSSVTQGNMRLTASHIARDLATSGAVADKRYVVEIEVCNEFVEIVSPSVHIVAIPSLFRPTVAATIMSNGTEAVTGQEEHLGFPGIGCQGPSVAEDDGGARLAAPVLVEEGRIVTEREVRHRGDEETVRRGQC